jgi:uncharacterized protein
MNDLPMLLGAGLLGGAMNAIAGGGSAVILPAMIAAGLPSVTANASCTVAMFPGNLLSVWAYRDGLRGWGGLSLGAMLTASLAGGGTGGLLLLATPSRTFDQVIPWLLLLATFALACGPRVALYLASRGTHIGRGPLLLAQFALAVYGGYFGGAVGIMMMAVWSLVDGGGVKAMNPAKTMMVSASNAIAVVAFIIAGAVRWPETLALLAAGMVGGYSGARLARRMAPDLLRVGTVLLTAAMTAYFFWRAL